MTLIASVRTLEGIVIAGDSLATYSTTPTVSGDVDITCPQCQHQHSVQAQLEGDAYAATTLSYAQKIFPFFENYGMGIFHNLHVSSRTVRFAIKEFEKACAANAAPKSVGEAAEMAGQYLYGLLVKDHIDAGLDINQRPDDWFYNGFQLVGYDKGMPFTYLVWIGKTVKIDKFNGFNVSVNGDLEIIIPLFDLYSSNPKSFPLFNGFSLQDAIEYADFLIRTTALHQRFSQTTPSVGGEIDIGLVTPFDGFRWVRQKKLYN